MSVVGEEDFDVECIPNKRPKKDEEFECLVEPRGLSYKEEEKEIILHEHGKRPRGRPRKIVELVPSTTESSSSTSSPDDYIGAEMVKPDCNTCESHPVLQKEATEEPVKKKRGRKSSLPKKLLNTPSKTSPRQPKPAIKKTLLPEGITRSSRNLLGELSGQPGSSSGQAQDAPQASTGSPNGRQTSKKSRELPVELRNKIIERHESGDGYRKISKSLNISSSTVRSIILKWKVHCTTVSLPRSGRPSKLSNQARSRLVSEVTVRPTVTLKELKSSIAEMGENVCESTISRSLHRSGLYYAVKLVPAATESGSSISSPDDKIGAEMVKPDCNTSESHPVPQKEAESAVASEEPVKKKRGRKALPLEPRAKILLKTPKALPRRAKPAIKKSALPEGITRSSRSRNLLGELSGQPGSSSGQDQDAPQASAASPNGRQSTKKSKELPVELRNEIIERHESGEGYKKISKSLNICSSTVGSIIRKWKAHRTTETLPRSGRPTKLSNQARSRLVSEVTVRPTVTLKELESSIAELGENVSESAISRSLHKAGMYCTVELVPIKTELSYTISSPDDDISGEMVTPHCNARESQPLPQEEAQSAVTREEPVKKKRARKALPKKLLKTPKALSKQLKPAIKKPVLPEGITRSSRNLLGELSGQPGSSSGQDQDAPQASAGSPNGRQTSKKSRELPIELRNKIIERHESGDGYRKISKSLNISSSTVRSIVLKWKVHCTTVSLPRSGRPSKLSNQARSRLVNEVTVRPTVTLKELKSSIAEMGENVCESTISRSLHKSGLYYAVKLVPVTTESGSSISSPDDEIGAEMVKPDCNTSESHPVPQKEAESAVASEEPVKKKRGRKALPLESRAKILLKTPKALPRRAKPAIKKSALPEGITRSSRSRNLLGELSGQPGSSSGQDQDAPQASTASPNGRQTTKKSKELPVELRNKIIEKHESGEGYKKISKSLNISSSTVGSIILKWKAHRTTETLPRSGRPTKLSNQARSRLVSEATVRPTVTLKELKSSIAEMGENVSESTISRSLHKSGLYWKGAERKAQIKEMHLQTQQGSSSSQDLPCSEVWWWEHYVKDILGQKNDEASQE